ncbi:MAG: flagellar assembly protein FliH [Desulfovibrio sp.]|nr:flagellar assembly protein FliH [Desulfovibrio sp.]
MPSSELRKKWGTIFMGEREATMEQLDAMQEPVLRERLQKDQQKDYIERVRKRAADRAREILAEAYTERQKIIQEAKEAIEAERAKLMQEIASIRQEAEKMRSDAKTELTRAEAVGREADTIRKNAHDEGFKTGMDQAGVELREFRADMGNELAQLMRAVEGQISAITAYWRDDLAELTRVAVRCGTGYILEAQHEAILDALVFQALNLLEQREVVTLRVNPEDESIVSDLFKAAREKAPELKQWIVNGDESIARAGLIAESGSGSVDLRRQNFEELLHSILDHLSLPVREAEKEALAALHDQVETSTLRFSAPEDDAVTQAEESLQAEKTAEEEAVQSPQPLPKESPHPQTIHEEKPLSKDVSDSPQENSEHPVEEEDFVLPEDVFDAEDAVSPQKADESKSIADALEAELLPDPDNASIAGTPSLPDNPSEPVASAPPPPKSANDPSLAELEDELFPVNQDEEHDVLQHGGLLPNNQDS